MLDVLPVVFLVVGVSLVLLFFWAYCRLFKYENPVADLVEHENVRLTYPRTRYPMERKDLYPLLLITLIYAAVAFWGLGDHTDPETFCNFSEKGRYVVIELPEDTAVSRVMYYSGIYTGNYFLQYSDDGINYSDEAVLSQKYSEIYKWQNAKLKEENKSAKYIRIVADSHLEMGELAIYDAFGARIPATQLRFSGGVAPLFDEQNIVPDQPSYMNSTYFDEVYHVRTAVEHMRGIEPYEYTHPPLGKIIIGLGIRMFGLNPFGWRFMGVLFGILMLPCFYVFVKNLFGSTPIACCGTLLFAFDFMHFVQTRIATIDTYGVIFIILMYLFMYRYITFPRDDPAAPQKGDTLDLFLSGLFFGIGAACKWTAIYAGVGLFLIWIWYRIERYRELKAIGHLAEHRRELWTNIGQCLLFFILIPAVIYYLSYYYYGVAKGWSGIQMYFTKDYAKLVVDTQARMFNYHKGVHAYHPYASRWYQWIVDGRPILYYLTYNDDGTINDFGAFLNPFVCWGGLLAMFAMGWKTFKYKDGKAAFILIGYLAQLVPWMLIGRITFEYHYFPSLIFLVLAICHCFNSFRLRSSEWKKYVYGATAACLALFVIFYPVLTGITITLNHGKLLSWIPGAWPFH